MVFGPVHVNGRMPHQNLHNGKGIAAFRSSAVVGNGGYAVFAVTFVTDIMAVFTARRAHETPAAHPAEAFESIISVGIGSISNAFAIDADGIMWDMAIHGDGDWREQTAPQADAVWCP